MSPQSSISIYLIGLLGVLFLCSMTALVAYQLGLDRQGEFRVRPVVVSNDADSAVVQDVPGADDTTQDLREKLSLNEQELVGIGAENRKYVAEITRLVGELETAKRNTSELELLVGGLKQQLQIDQTAYGDLKVSLKQSARDMTNLRDELNFYRNILSPDQSSTQVQIDQFSINPMDVPDSYEYRMTLIQTKHHDKQMIGTLEVAIEGEEDGIRKIVDVGIFGTPPPVLNFKYYQKVRGVFSIPPGFKATGITLKFTARDSEEHLVSEVHPWPEVSANALVQ